MFGSVARGLEAISIFVGKRATDFVAILLSRSECSVVSVDAMFQLLIRMYHNYVASCDNSRCCSLLIVVP